MLQLQFFIAFKKAKINVQTMKVALRKSDSVRLHLHITQLIFCPAFGEEMSSLQTSRSKKYGV